MRHVELYKSVYTLYIYTCENRNTTFSLCIIVTQLGGAPSGQVTSIGLFATFKTQGKTQGKKTYIHPVPLHWLHPATYVTAMHEENVTLTADMYRLAQVMHTGQIRFCQTHAFTEEGSSCTLLKKLLAETFNEHLHYFPVMYVINGCIQLSGQLTWILLCFLQALYHCKWRRPSSEQLL